ncbi:MAG: methionyl-tRNA formyltransferase, partial [Candidatus Margulisiibacteriota bacterium]
SSLTKESGEIDWRKSASELHNRVRALIPWPAAHTYYNKKQLKLLVTQIAGPVLEKKGQPGEIIQVVKGIGFLVSCGDGNLLIVKVQPEGGKIMSAFDFAIGRQLKPGIVFPS